MQSRFAVAVLFSVSCVGVWAQPASVSQIAGTVQDSSGLAVADAQVKVTQTATGLTRTAVSNSDGGYVLPSLPVGPYRMEVTKSGFSTFVQTDIVLQVDSNAVLKVGNVSEQVVVEAAATMVETHSTGVGQVVDSQRISEIPLNGRYATDLIYLVGAAAPAPVADLVSAKNYPNEAVVSVAGGQATGTTYLLDGGTHNDPFNSLNLPLPFPDALQEFKVETSALPAQYGQHAGGAVNAVTKSGSNQYHGNLFEFVRNYKFNSRNPGAVARDSLKRNEFGGTFGGPILKDKLFFFLGYQGNIQRSNPTASFANIPTPAMISGDFTAYTSAACQGGKAVTLKAPYVNNVLPTSFISSVAVKMMSHYPVTATDCGPDRLRRGAESGRAHGRGARRLPVKRQAIAILRYLVTHSLQPSLSMERIR
jgi:hypothetical protein